MGTIRVEVVYALPDAMEARSVTLPAGATAGQALRASGILERHPELRPQRVGVFGRVVGLDAALADGDRVEIYRPLAMDPKEARRRRASGRR